MEITVKVSFSNSGKESTERYSTLNSPFFLSEIPTSSHSGTYGTHQYGNDSQPHPLLVSGVPPAPPATYTEPHSSSPLPVSADMSVSSYGPPAISVPSCLLSSPIPAGDGSGRREREGG